MAEDRSRAQLALAAALLVAVLLVSTAVVLNSVLVTQNRATQSGPAEADPEAYRAAVVDRSADALLRINSGNDANDSHATLLDDLEADLSTWQESTGRQYVVSGRSVDVRVAAVEEGTRIRQNESSGLVPDGGLGAGRSNWTLVRDVEGVHRFELNVSVDSLLNVSDTTNVSTLREEALHVTVATDLIAWRVYLFEEESTDELHVLVEDTTSPYPPAEEFADLKGSDTCAEAGENVTVRLADALVGPNSCADLGFLRPLDEPYDVHYNRSAGNNGTYDLFVDRESVRGGPYAQMGSGNPFRQTALYAATVEVVYRDPDIDYRAAPWVAPEPAPH